MATKKDEVMPQQTQSATPAEAPKKGSSIHPLIIQAGLVPFIMQPKSAYIASGGTEEEFNREANFTSDLLVANNFLFDCAKKDPQALAAAVKNVGLTGLTLNPELKLGYLVPFKGRIKFMASYMGKMEILIRTGVVKSIYAELVYEKDQFVYRKGVNATLEHTPNVFAKDRGAVVGGYYYAVLTNGQVMYDVMPMERIEEIKKRSESAKSGSSPWFTDPKEMMKKTILNWAFKSLPKTGISESMIEAIEAEQDFEKEDFEDWRKSQEVQKDPFKDDGKFTDFEEVKDETNS